MRALLTGGNGMLGRSIRGAWASARPSEVLTAVTRDEVDLRSRDAVARIIAHTKPELVIHAAAKVGGISANIADPSSFLSDNLSIDTNVIEASREAGVSRLIYFGSSCMYPRDYRQPLVEGDLLAAPLEPTNEGYAIAKIAGAKLCEYISRSNSVHFKVLIPSNLYGPNDHFGSSASHLVAAAIYKAHVAKVQAAEHVDVWGDGTARREFTFVDDIAEWIVRSADSIDDWPSMMNLGSGIDHSIADYYSEALEAVSYQCRLAFDPSKPAGMRQKLMDSSLAGRYGWKPTTDLRRGMQLAYESFMSANISPEI